MRILYTSLLICSCILFGVTNTLTAKETPNEELAKWKAKYPDKNGVIILKHEDVLIKVNSDGKLSIISTIYSERLLFNDNAKRYSGGSVYADSFTNIRIVEAYSLVNENNKYKKHKVKTFKESDAISGSIFYSDSKQTNFNFTGLAAGTKTFLKYENEYLEPRFFGSFYFASYLPIDKSLYTITCPADLELKWEIFGLDTEKIQHQVTEKGKQKIYHWQMNEVSQYKNGNNAPNFRYYYPHIQMRIAQYKYKDQTIPVLRNLDDLFAWYATLIAPVNQTISPDLKQLADSITVDAKNELEKVERIYYWVQNNIKYVAIENGLGGFVPREAHQVFNRRYGDCKDMSSILYSLLKAIGVEGHLTWIGSRAIPYKYHEVPTPVVDNHMICTYIDEDDKPHFLDATARNLPIEIPNGFIQGKEALINLGDGKYRVAQVPIVPRTKNVFADSIVIYIDEKNFSGSGKAWMNGYFQVNMHQAIDALTSAHKENYFQSFFRKGNNTSSTRVIKVNHQNITDPLTILYDFKVSNYATVSENELYFNPHIFKRFKDLEIDTKNEFFAVENDDCNSQYFHITIHPPVGHRIKYLPEDKVFNNELFGFNFTYKSNDDKSSAIVTLEVYENYLLLHEDKFETYNEMSLQLRKAFNELIIFEQK